MVVNFEFLGSEPIENVITCMHFKVDKAVFFGYHDVVLSKRKSTENFLKKYCGVSRVVFHELSGYDLQSVLKTMRTEIEYEKGNGSKLYFDITGGESLILVAFGMLSKEFEAPMHIFDIEKDRLIELDEGARASISKDVESNNVEFNIERYIEMRGGIINWGLHKTIKEDEDDEFVEDIAKIWKVAKKHIAAWNAFSTYIRTNMKPDDDLRVSRSARTVINELSVSPRELNNVNKLNSIVDDLESEGILTDVVHSDGRYRFRYKNEGIMACLWEGGSALELQTYQNVKKESDDCKVGIHLDWDGEIHDMSGIDVVNEIDVLSLKGNVLTFFSCKSGKMKPRESMYALYELDTVAKRFGGKYAKKVLVTAMGLNNTALERADEMGIEVRVG